MICESSKCHYIVISPKFDNRSFNDDIGTIKIDVSIFVLFFCCSFLILVMNTCASKFPSNWKREVIFETKFFFSFFYFIFLYFRWDKKKKEKKTRSYDSNWSSLNIIFGIFFSNNCVFFLQLFDKFLNYFKTRTSQILR